MSDASPELPPDAGLEVRTYFVRSRNVLLARADELTAWQAALAPDADILLYGCAAGAGPAGARDGGHYTVRVCSARFKGLPRLARHRLVYAALGPLPALGVHALALQTWAPEET
jgi:BolA protein